MKHAAPLIATLLALSSPMAMAEKCLNPDKDKYATNDRRHTDYIDCPVTTETNKYGAIGAIGSILSRYVGNDSGPSKSEQDENIRRVEQSIAKDVAARKAVRYGAAVEIGGINYSQWQYDTAGLTDDQRQSATRAIQTAIDSGQFLQTYGAVNFAQSEAWKSVDPVVRYTNCEVATRLVQAYVLGEFGATEQKNPAQGLAIARTGQAERCGGTAYWQGRIYEAGDALVPGVDAGDLRGGKDVKVKIIAAYDVAILNGYMPAHERMASLYEKQGPERFFAGRYFSLLDFKQVDYWPQSRGSDERFLMRVGYTRCLEADPTRAPCAEGLARLHADTSKGYDGYTDYSPEKVAQYQALAKKLVR